MATKWNNKRLSVIFIVLIVAFFLIRYLNSDKKQGNFNPEMISLDTGAVNEILLYPKVAEGKEIRFYKENGFWMVSKDGFSAKAMKPTVKSLINSIKSMKPTRLAARSEEKWEQFHVNDSLGTKVRVLLKDGEELGLVIGKFSYQQPAGPSGMQSRVKTTSYFRKLDENEVYATDGFLTMTFNRDINSFRDQTLSKLKKDNVKSMRFDMPGDSSYALVKSDSLWMIDNKMADQTKVNLLVSKLVMNNQNQFADDFEPQGDPVYGLNIFGDNMNDISISVFEMDSNTVIMNSSLNPEAMFRVDKSGLFTELFKSPGFYLDSLQN